MMSTKHIEFRDIRNLSAAELLKVWGSVGYRGLGEYVITYNGGDCYMDQEDYNELLSTFAHAYLDEHANEIKGEKQGD